MPRAAILQLWALSSFLMFPSQYSIKIEFSDCILKVTFIDTVTSSSRLTFLIDDYVCIFSFSRCIWRKINLIWSVK